MIPIENTHIEVAAQTHPGRSGKNNEDRFGVSAYRLSESDPTHALLAVVCDGIGGHRAGEVAAELAVETISQAVANSDGREPTEVMGAAIVRASELIRGQAEEDPNKKGMGATCACAWILDDRLYTASVGDSRIYLVRGQKIRQLTVDHTWVQEALDHGALTPAQARDHPNVHVIRRYLGSERQVEPDFRLRLESGVSDEKAERNQGFQLQPGDRLLLCSDGLTDLVEDDEIRAALQTSQMEAAVQYLINLANHRGGHDNITVVAILYPREPGGVVQEGTSRLAVLACGGVAFIVLVALIAAVLLGLYFTRPYLPPVF